MHDSVPDRRVGCKRARAGAGAITMRALLLVLLAAGPHVPCSDALKLASISEDRGHLGVGLLRAVEVVRGRYERAWALISAAEPTAEELETALELLQANAKQWESLEPAVKLWTERDVPQHSRSGASKSTDSTKTSAEHRSSAGATAAAAGSSGGSNEQQQDDRAPGAPGASDTASHVYEEAASLLAHNRAVLGQALARSGHTDQGIAELEVACPEILEYQQNAQGRRDSKSWLHCYANLAEMYKTQKRFEEASSLLARMPWLPSPQGAGAGSDDANSPESSTVRGGDVGGNTPAAPPSTDPTVSDRGDSTQDGGVEEFGAGEGGGQNSSKPTSTGEIENTAATGGASGDAATDAPTSTPPSKGASGGRSDAPPARGAGAARVAGLNKAAAAASAAAAAESAAAAAGAVETGAEAAARAVMERHAEAMRASMNELVGELAVTTATRPSASQDWLDSRVAAAEEVLAAVRSGLLVVGGTTSEQTVGTVAASETSVADIPAMLVGAPGHADILREASHYLSAIKGVKAQGWAYVDNELHRMERHPAQAVKPGFQNRREVIHTFRYLLMKARQYASENQNQSSRSSSGTTSSSSSGSGGSRWRRKDRGRKASASSKAPRKGSAARGNRSSRSDADASSQEGDGLLTLFVGAGIALLVAAVSSGGSRGHGRRREVVRQRTATRAAKTVGSYVEPPQRTAVAALLFHVWGNLKRSGLLVSSHAITTANLARALLLTAWASVLENIGAALDSARSKRATGGGKTAFAAPAKKSASAAPGGNKQRSKKNAKKASAAPTLPLLRGDTVVVTPPASPPAVAQPSSRTAPTNRSVAGTTPPFVDSVPSTEKAAAVASVPKPTAATKVVGTSDSHAFSKGAADAGRPVVPAAPVAARLAVAEQTTGVPFLDVMTAEQVQAMVEEDERAWEQARLSDKLHSKADAAAAAAATSAAAVTAPAAVAQRAADAEVEDGAGAGWSEVGSSGSRSRAGGGAAARGRVLSIRNVRAAALSARTSSPGSDPATTTSASSSDSSEGCKIKSSRGGGRAAGRGGGRVVQGAAKSSATPRAGNKSTWAAASGPNRSSAAAAARSQHSSRGLAQARAAPPTRDSEQATSRPSRAPQAPWAAARNGASTAQALRGGGKPAGASNSAVIVGEAPSVPRGSSLSETRPAITVNRRSEAPPSSLRQPLRPEVPAFGGSETVVVEGENVKGEEPAGPSAQPPPAAWTNTPSHPLGMQPEPVPLPPASEPPRPPPQHQQHWQRQQQREQQQQQQHFFHQQESHLMPMPAVPMQQHQDAGSHHYPPLSLPPQPPHHHHHQHHQRPPPPPQQQQQQQHVVAMPQFIPASDEAFPPPSAHPPIPIPAANAPPPTTSAMIYPAHPAHIVTVPSPGVSPGGGHVAAGGGGPHFHVRDGSYDSPGSAGGAGFSADAGAVLAHPQAVVLPPPPYEQQRQQQQVGGRFSPLTLQVVPVEEVDGDGGEAFEALMGALRWQVEYYFSADNLVTDSYLRGLMDPEGFVAVSKIIVFNRVRRMTSDCSLLIAAMRRSNELEIMEQDHAGETRVRTRHSPLHWTREQLPPSRAPSPILEEEHAEEEEEEEEEEHHITFGNVSEVIGLDEPASAASRE